MSENGVRAWSRGEGLGGGAFRRSSCLRWRDTEIAAKTEAVSRGSCAGLWLEYARLKQGVDDQITAP
jgi:hypothetical protein